MIFVCLQNHEGSQILRIQLKSLCTCALQLLSLTPEEPGLDADLRSETLRSRLAKIVPLLLRLVSLILSSLPNSRQARELGAAFMEAHHRALIRILREAVSPAIRCSNLDLHRGVFSQQMQRPKGMQCCFFGLEVRNACTPIPNLRAPHVTETHGMTSSQKVLPLQKDWYRRCRA